MKSDKKKMTRVDFIKEVKKLGFPVTVQGRAQLAERSHESMATISQRLQKTTRNQQTKIISEKRTNK